MSVQPITGLNETMRIHSSVRDLPHYTIAMPDPQGRMFTAIHHDVNWIWEKVNCLYAGNHQGGPIYEVDDPNDPVIAGEYTDYIVSAPFNETGYLFGLFDDLQC